MANKATNIEGASAGIPQATPFDAMNMTLSGIRTAESRLDFEGFKMGGAAAVTWIEGRRDGFLRALPKLADLAADVRLQKRDELIETEVATIEGELAKQSAALDAKIAQHPLQTASDRAKVSDAFMAAVWASFRDADPLTVEALYMGADDRVAAAIEQAPPALLSSKEGGLPRLAPLVSAEAIQRRAERTAPADVLAKREELTRIKSALSLIFGAAVQGLQAIK